MVVVSNDLINHPSAYVVAARVTAHPSSVDLPTLVELEPGDVNLPMRSWVLCHDLYTIRAAAIDEQPIGRLTAEKLDELQRKLRLALAL